MVKKPIPFAEEWVQKRIWDPRWLAVKSEYGNLLQEDLNIRKMLLEALKAAAVSKIVIERPHRRCRVWIHTARPGMVIGKKGADIGEIRAKVKQFTDSEVHINIVEVLKPEIDATLIAQGIAQQVERRVALRRAMKRAMQTAIRMGVGGIRVNVGGRLGGGDIARTEWYREGRVPLHTLRADIDYGTAQAETTYGIIGIKVWILKGEVLDPDRQKPDHGNTSLHNQQKPLSDDLASSNHRTSKLAVQIREALYPYSSTTVSLEELLALARLSVIDKSFLGAVTLLCAGSDAVLALEGTTAEHSMVRGLSGQELYAALQGENDRSSEEAILAPHAINVAFRVL